MLSRSKRDARGRVLAPSPLVPAAAVVETLRRGDAPGHAYSEADRRLARPGEAAGLANVSRATTCILARRSAVIGPHDGRVRPDHPVVLRAFAATQSATSLKLMLRDPLAFVWRYGLGWRSTVGEAMPLSLDDRGFGELVHELLHATSVTLIPSGGAGAASPDCIASALASAAKSIQLTWPTSRRTPPPVLWRETVEAASSMALSALTMDGTLQVGTRTWTELPFGDAPDGFVADELPWDAAKPVFIPGTPIRIRGSIDRLDLSADGVSVRVSDYKTGRPPPKMDVAKLRGGRELQRLVYAAAVLGNIPDVRRIVSRLVHLANGNTQAFKLEGVTDALGTFARHLLDAETLLHQGLTLPGPDAWEDCNPFALALPAKTENYAALKSAGLRRSFGDFAHVWTSR